MDDQINPVMGIDVSKKKLDLALLNDGKCKHKVFPNDSAGHTAVVTWLHKHGVQSAHICLESTNIYGETLAEVLHDAGYVVSIVNPARIKGFALSELARTKTDKTDASLIARFCQAMVPSPWVPDPLEIRALKALVRRLEGLNEMRQQEVNRCHVAPDIIKHDIEYHIAILDKVIKETKKRIRDHIDNHPDLKQKKSLLESIPGIGEATIGIILSEFSRIESFTNGKALAAFIGVAPRERQSGSSLHGRSRMSKTGRSQLRKAFFMPAMVALRYNPILIDMKTRLADAGKSKMTIVGAAMRKLVHLIYGVLKSGVPFDPNYVNRKV
jgi:transposase